MTHTHPKTSRIIIAACLVIFVVCIFCVTNTTRTIVSLHANRELFWSYKEILRGNQFTFKEVVLNIALFAPVGFMAAALMEKASTLRRILVAALAGLVLTVTVESIQYIFHIGLSDLDDIFNNTLGALIGAAFCCFIEPRLPKAVLILSVLAAIAGTAYVIIDPKEDKPIEFAVKIEEVNDGRIKGYCFPYDGAPDNMQLILSDSMNSKYYYLDTEYGIPRPDVNEHFKSAEDLTYCGFEADFSELEGKITPEQLLTNDDNEFAEYYINVRFDNKPIESSLEYLSARLDENGGIYWTQSGAPIIWEKQLDAVGTDLEEIVSRGKSIFAELDEDVWMYQYGDDLYWIAGPDFRFEEDGSTQIRYLLHTVQEGSQFPNGRNDDNHWDDRSGDFEDHEITGEMDCGKYRVSRRELPREYVTTDFKTGYCINGRWKWFVYCRPDL